MRQAVDAESESNTKSCASGVNSGDNGGATQCDQPSIGQTGRIPKAPQVMNLSPRCRKSTVNRRVVETGGKNYRFRVLPTPHSSTADPPFGFGNPAGGDRPADESSDSRNASSGLNRESGRDDDGEARLGALPGFGTAVVEIGAGRGPLQIPPGHSVFRYSTSCQRCSSVSLSVP